MVVNGTTSEWSMVRSGVPQGTVFGPLLFLLYINDLPMGLNSSVKLFADDSVLFRKIENPSNNLLLQKDLDTLQGWSETWQMKFEPSKCYKLTITLKKNPEDYTYSLCDTELVQVSYHKYLGVVISETLSWSKHCVELRAKANRILGILQRNLSNCSLGIKERSYTSLVQPLLNYSTTAWSPHLAKDKATIESVQRRAARFVTGDYRHTSSVTQMLHDLNWKTLELQRHINDLTFFYKMHHNLIGISFSSEVEMYYRSSRIHNKYNYKQISPSLNVYKNSFFVRTIPSWNALPTYSVSAPSVDSFKSHVFAFCN